MVEAWSLGEPVASRLKGFLHMHDPGTEVQRIYGFELDPPSLAAGVVRWQETDHCPVPSLRHLAASKVSLQHVRVHGLPVELHEYLLQFRQAAATQPASQQRTNYDGPEDHLALQYQTGQLDEGEYVLGAVDGLQRAGRRAQVLLQRMRGCRSEGRDALACRCQDGFVCQVQRAIGEVLCAHQVKVPVALVFVEAVDLDTDADPSHRVFITVQRCGEENARHEQDQALCMVVNGLGVAALTMRPAWIYLAQETSSHAYIYFTYCMYFVCLACVLCVMHTPAP
eukprot:comp21464_c4_seq1/m.29699 comp21464_c4_seq1/g.29699  ORF comp21464_c4_seq1/g.29699 comp21464_c4_seq1/m.29699 type:complete len:282 (-) comp21464_c4_seq1:198-1043(-)